MTVVRLELKNFTVFEQAAFEFCPGINVLIGENGTGKTHVLKAMYAALRGSEASEAELFDKFRRVFRPDPYSLERLLRRDSPGPWFLRMDDAAGGQMQLQWLRADSQGHGTASLSTSELPALFVPPREVLAMYSGFVPAYEGRELDFDETYYDICKALGAAPLRGSRAAAVAGLLEPLEKILGGKVQLAGTRFRVLGQRGDTEAHMLAEGLRKIGTLAYLVANGTITPRAAVFWDEPEASLNPRLVVQVVEFVRALARAGVQVFLASHDFLLVHRLSQPAEHGLEPAVPIRFFSLYRPEPGAPVEVEAADTLADIEHNAILDEFARYYDDERAYSWRELAGEAEPAATAKTTSATKATTKPPSAARVHATGGKKTAKKGVARKATTSKTASKKPAKAAAARTASKTASNKATAKKAATAGAASKQAAHKKSRHG